jgi:S-phase kinase-associated protein 1
MPNRKDLKMSEVVTAWDATFIDKFEMDKETLMRIIVAANYLDIPGLLDLGMGKIAQMVNNLHDIDKIKEAFNIEKDITPEEERIVREQNPWIFDVSSLVQEVEELEE